MFKTVWMKIRRNRCIFEYPVGLYTKYRKVLVEPAYIFYIAGIEDKMPDWGSSNSACRYPHPYSSPPDEYGVFWTANIKTVSVMKGKSLIDY